MEQLQKLKRFHACGKDRFEACCPGHDDRKQSLSIRIGEDGKILLKCHAGCELGAILEPIGLMPRDLFPDNGNRSERHIIAVYDYCTPEGALAYQVVRFEPKDFRQRKPDGNGGWIWKISDLDRLPYRLPNLCGSDYIFIVEGEKDVDNLRGIGLAATCNSGGAGKWTEELTKYFRQNQHIAILPDNDNPGRKHAEQVARSLYGKVASVKILKLAGLPEKGDVSDWLKGKDPQSAAEELCKLSEAAEEWESRASSDGCDEELQQDSSAIRNDDSLQVEYPPDAEGRTVSLEDFYAYMPMHSYIYVPGRDLWPAASINSRIKLKSHLGESIKATSWLDINRPVEKMTWAPGLPMLIKNRLIYEGGWIERRGSACFNLYHPPQIVQGYPARAERWIEHIRFIYGADTEHIVRWLAHRVQHPGEKINHALVLGGPQGIGKDTLLEPVKHAVGEWNFKEVSPTHVLGRFNGWIKSVILRINEARDLGEVDRYSFYDHMKAYTASPPDVLRCDEKNIREYDVLNVCGVIITSNHKTDGIYLPEDDRRHYVAWSDCTKDDFSPDYWKDLYRWYQCEGHGHVAAYLRTLNISAFDPKAPPPKTDAFWAIVDANRAPEDAELSDAIEALGSPEAVTLANIISYTGRDFGDWLRDRKNSRQIPHRMEAVDYVPIRNTGAKDGQWKIAGKRQTVYARRNLTVRDRIEAAMRLAGR